MDSTIADALGSQIDPLWLAMVVAVVPMPEFGMKLLVDWLSVMLQLAKDWPMLVLRVVPALAQELMEPTSLQFALENTATAMATTEMSVVSLRLVSSSPAMWDAHQI